MAGGNRNDSGPYARRAPSDHAHTGRVAGVGRLALQAPYAEQGGGDPGTFEARLAAEGFVLADDRAKSQEFGVIPDNAGEEQSGDRTEN